MPATTRAIRLNVAQAAHEFGLHQETLRKRIRQAGIEPGADRKFSIRQVCSAVFGDLTGERTRESRARADKLEFDLATARNEVIHRERVFQFLENVFIAVKMKIMDTSLSDLEKERILLDLVTLRDADL